MLDKSGLLERAKLLDVILNEKDTEKHMDHFTANMGASNYTPAVLSSHEEQTRNDIIDQLQPCKALYQAIPSLHSSQETINQLILQAADRVMSKNPTEFESRFIAVNETLIVLLKLCSPDETDTTSIVHAVEVMREKLKTIQP
ncbi:UNVERIFIED_CONTAM: hypothetical protein HDU68_001412 [Siphonaria sp. JEL0065]|nr:hypothetical protein HDU68_001412 [Siphonaria sp. JEL0065]